jgi:16S rRNA G966 N2-methylase RsmD
MSQFELSLDSTRLAADKKTHSPQRTEPISTEEKLLSDSVLNINGKTRSNLFPWRGQFSPQLCEALLRSYATSGQHILDPFAGSGTVLVEAARLSMRATGTEINPAAALMAKTYDLCALKEPERLRLVEAVNVVVGNAISHGDSPLFEQKLTKEQKIEEALVRATNAAATEAGILLSALVVLLDLYQSPATASRVSQAWEKLRKLFLSLPYADLPVQVMMCDARKIPLAEHSIDLVLTSPPYINVFNYHQQFRRSVEALGWNVLRVASSEIGANRKFRGNRFLTVAQYHLDMAEALAEMGRTCKPEARIILVVGRESNVQKTSFQNSKILSRIAVEQLGLQLVLQQERVFTNRFGQSIYEDLLHFRPSSQMKKLDMTSLLTQAKQELEGARNRVHKDTREDLEEAITNVFTVSPSPIAKPTSAKKDLLQSE